MEFPELGKNCSHSECKRLDFIPLKCQCLNFFCKEHFTEHCISGGCSFYSKLEKEVNLNSESPIYKCNFEKCKAASYLKLPCPKCDKHFCIAHRFHPECPEIDPEVLQAEKKRWEEPRRQFDKAKALVESEVTKKLRISQQSSAKAKTAFKIQLMKLKSRAKGEASIPVVDRIYFAVKKPPNRFAKKLTDTPRVLVDDKTEPIQDLSNAVFVSKDWSLGRVIDSVSNILSIRNENNVPKAPKLRVFREVDGMGVHLKEMDKKLSGLLDSDVLINGDKIMLDYVELDNLSDPSEVYFLRE